jgi:hypothetical protein
MECFSSHHLRILPFLVCGAIFSDYRGLVFSGQSDKALQVFKQKNSITVCVNSFSPSCFDAMCISCVALREAGDLARPGPAHFLETRRNDIQDVDDRLWLYAALHKHRPSIIEVSVTA